ncbi:hypothetical protein JQ557_05425 [Bradyrhizobium sp. U87765 SZCCT0131]|uniref:adenylate/guanylate cyclase domain-containing protein n=1 Tax=unclassified Bradyrhizobium TaxID=2631580 RepID=UPI001BA47C40|nr:hypothetical protein [Bradyrhizobium sp. U87765 SZCCT0131]MBR1264982.1 hypothetical protein [Bradyrhizobium sp. U87765 SZCCT0134]MBR1304964.1 hypothetical protein [Bradyrhizobium sp. U87765 SZCCT0110]MBR1320750.1 hypothetical protein [Bradyrhizobium sp. U87765 SZCCT0109]MBR1349170.1 hypothetical protein [Bradyrhizobium sp. U87765 SZCCT0048]
MAADAENGSERQGGSRRRRTIPLSGTLATVMAGLVALTAFIVLAVFWLATASTTRQLLADNASLAMDAIERRLDDWFTPVTNQLNFLAREFAGKHGQMPPAAMDMLLSGAVAGTPQVRALSLVSPDGAVRGVSQGSSGAVRFSDTLRTDGERQRIEDARTRVDVHMGPVYYVADPDLGTSVADVMRSVHDGDRFLGVLTATITVDEPSRYLKAIAASLPGSTPFVLYGRDRVLAHPSMVDKRPSLSRERPLPGLDAVGDPFLAALWTDGEPVDIGGHNFEARIVRHGGDGRVILTRAVPDVSAVPMITGVELPLSVLEKPITDLMRAGLAGLVVLLIAIAAAIVVSRMIVRPVGAMADEVRAVGSLDFSALQPLPGSVFSELNDQAQAYNTMLTGLRWLETYVPRSLVRRLVRSADGGHVLSAGRVVTVMFTDIVDFTRTAEIMPAADVADMLNDHFDLLWRCVEAEGGTVDKFIGDCVMAFWGAPDDQPDHADRALRTVRAIAAALAADNVARAARGLAPIRVRVGLHSGPVVAGNIGARERSGYTIVGDTVNLGSRLEQLGKSVTSDDDIVVLVSGDTVGVLQDGRDDLKPLGPHAVPGRATTIDVFRLQLPRP